MHLQRDCIHIQLKDSVKEFLQLLLLLKNNFNKFSYAINFLSSYVMLKKQNGDDSYELSSAKSYELEQFNLDLNAPD